MIGSIDNRIIEGATLIGKGRHLSNDPSLAKAGRLLIQEGNAEASAAFGEVQRLKDPLTFINSEELFLKVTLQLWDKKDKEFVNSLETAIKQFDEAKKALLKVGNKEKYQDANDTYSFKTKTKEGLPVDAFHLACNSHKTRLQNMLRAPLDMEEKELITQRKANMDTALKLYKTKRIPRIRGGDPVLFRFVLVRKLYSPHTRG